MEEQATTDPLEGVSTDNRKRLSEMMDHCIKMMEAANASDGNIECLAIFFDRNNIPFTMRSGVRMSVGGLLEAMSMLMMRGGVSEDHQMKIREELAMWAMERVGGVEAAKEAASNLVKVERPGIILPGK